MSLQVSEMESRACSSLFELVKDYLTKLSFCGRFLDDLSTGEEESIDFLTTSFSLFRELGKLSFNSNQVEGLIPKFREALEKSKSKKVSVETVFNSNYAGEKEWVDEVNYIYVWVLNSYGLNLKTSNVSEIQSKYASIETVEVEVQPENQLEGEGRTQKVLSGKRGRASSKHWGGLSIYRNIFRVHKLGDMDDEESFEYIVSKTQAMERLEREIRSGRVYVYLSKPSRNPILKKYFSYLCLVGIVFSGVTFLVALINATSNSSGSGGSNGKWHPTLFTVMSFIFFLLSWRENNRGLENENFKYCFSRKIFFYYFFLSSWFLLSSVGGTSSADGGYSSLFSGDTSATVFFALLVSVVIISVTFFLVGFFFLNPKKNKELIERLLNKYSSPPYLNR
ncbi:hypothetical protein [Candidatus Mycoplasma haematominutum]|uniref:Uncharacterized protein n=1 Tax=Candidatus Mycoplasma haematominutum 'Birmingham 1' TaxID=1116213 RepID=G8C3A8_9MOLU|nr:hypothetical protein [Candidatus Mycoplasma haematominutum]CCE66806.1 conserved haemoplasma hypothetical protein [Candidatus Mycoplasma haematominutum 'Birmingham 1']